MSTQPWGGRFGEEPDPLVDRFLRSLPVDHRLFREDVQGSRAYAGALVAARIARLVFGTRDLRFGGVRSKFQLADSDLLNHRVEIVEGILAAECVGLLQSFFAARR